MPIVLTGGTPVTIENRAFLDCVNNVLRSTGNRVVATLDSADTVTTRAMRGVDEAYREIYGRRKWQFRCGWWPLAPIASTMWYALRGDFSEPFEEQVINFPGATQPLVFRSYDALCREVADVIHYPPTADQGVAAAALATAEVDHFGAPTIYTIHAGFLGLWPIPNATWVAAAPEVMIPYLKGPIPLENDGDTLELSVALWNVLDSLAVAYFKQAMDYKDFRYDEQRGENRLGRATARENAQFPDHDFDLMPESFE